MKKIIALLLAIALTISGLSYTASTVKADSTFSLKLGEIYSNTIPNSYTSHIYEFDMTSKSNVQIIVTSDNTSTKSWRLISTDYSVTFPTQTTQSNVQAYLPGGKKYRLTITGKGAYALKIVKTAADKISLKKYSGKYSGSGQRYVWFTFTGTSDYAKANLKLKNSIPKVASASFSITGANSGKLYVNPKYCGKTVISLMMSGSNTVKFTLYSIKGYWYIAKGTKTKAIKPIGVKKVKWKSTKKKRITIKKKSGKIKAKKGGKCTLIAKSGGIKYKLKVYVTDYKKLAKKTYKEIKDSANNPRKVKIYNVYRGYYKLGTNLGSVPVIYFDFGSPNIFGATERTKIVSYYDEKGKFHYFYVGSAKKVKKKKRMSKKLFKK